MLINLPGTEWEVRCSQHAKPVDASLGLGVSGCCEEVGDDSLLPPVPHFLDPVLLHKDQPP